MADRGETEKPAYLTHLEDQAGAAIDEIRDHFAEQARNLNEQVRAGKLDRKQAVARLTSRYRLTERGAEDILNRGEGWSRRGSGGRG